MDGILFVVLVAMTLGGLAFSSFIQRYLKNNHPMTWQDLGSPSLIVNNSLKNNFLFRKFVKEQMSARGINDPVLRKMCKTYYFYTKAYLVLFGIIITWMFAGK